MHEFEIALHTGMRRSEQYEKALWENVDLLNNMITIQRPKKQSKPRRVRLNSRAQAVLKMLRPTPARGRLHSLVSPRSWFEDAVKASKLEGVCWHVLRHTFISRLVMKGIDIRTVQELAGHATIQMTMRYAHLAPSHVAQAVEKLVGVSTATETATEQESRAQEQEARIQ